MDLDAAEVLAVYLWPGLLALIEELLEVLRDARRPLGAWDLPRACLVCQGESWPWNGEPKVLAQVFLFGGELGPRDLGDFAVLWP